MAKQQNTRFTLKKKRLFTFKAEGQVKSYSTDPTIPPTTTTIFFNM